LVFSILLTFMIKFIVNYFILSASLFFFFFFNDTPTTEIYTLSLHDALPILSSLSFGIRSASRPGRILHCNKSDFCSEWPRLRSRSEEHTSELQSRENLVCRLLLEKKKNYNPFISSLTNTTKYYTKTFVISSA